MGRQDMRQRIYYAVDLPLNFEIVFPSFGLSTIPRENPFEADV